MIIHYDAEGNPQNRFNVVSLADPSVVRKAGGDDCEHE
jgi:hypothetical protein